MHDSKTMYIHHLALANYSQEITHHSILLFSDIEPIILSKVAHYSQIILNSEYIVCSIKLHAV